MGKKGEETKRLIRSAAKEIFSERGFKDVTMKDICERTGLSRGGLYMHYGSTKQIFSEIIDDMMHSQEDEYSGKIERGMAAASILEQVLERYINEMKDYQGSLSIAIYEYFSSCQNRTEDNVLLIQYRNSLSMWRNLLEYGIQTGDFKNVDIESVFDLLVFAYQGVRFFSTLMPVDDKTPERIISQIKKLLLHDYEENGGI